VLSPLGFALVAASFALPFVAARYDGDLEQFARTWHGVDLTIGGTARVHLAQLNWDAGLRQYVMRDVSTEMAPMLQGSANFMPGQPAFIAAIVAIAAGMLAEVLAGGRSRVFMSATAGILAAVALVLGEWLVMLRLDRGLAGPVPVPAYGFWLALSLLVLLAVANTVAAYGFRAVRQAAADARMPPHSGGTSPPSGLAS
jgi:hypothetical protein